MSIKRLLTLRIILGSIALVTFICGYWLYLSYQKFIDTPLNFSSNHANHFVIKKGTGVNQLSAQLAEQKIISNKFFLRVFTRLNPEYSQIKVGEYQLEKSETIQSLLKKFNEGKVIQYAWTLVEGMNQYEMLESLSTNEMLTQNITLTNNNIVETLNLQHQNIEGLFYPETYHFSKNADVSSLLKRAHKKLQAVLDEEWQNRAANLPYKTPYEALIMASIIEKETGIASERKQIAGVFVRRLQKKMRLQTDPTIIYGIGPSFNGDITYKDLKTPTPYNTYVIKGLPPTPIAMVTQKAINAALHPDDGKALYFVATGDGGHYFSETLEEHNKAVKRYLKKIKQR